MTVTALYEERVLFSPSMPAAVNQLLQAAVTATPSDKAQAETLFKQAQAIDSTCLQSYFALYKFYFYQGRLQEAEREVMAGLEEAARQGEFPSDYRKLASEPRKWNLYASDITHFYLYTLKALAFIKLRLNQALEAQLILSLIKELDPEDRCGASVIMSLSEALNES